MRLLLLSMLLVSCGANEATKYQTTKSEQVACTAKEVPKGVEISCPDGSVITINHGVNGNDGQDGTKGDEGAQGVAGRDGKDGSDGSKGKTCIKFKKVKRFIYKCIKYKSYN